MEHTRSLNNFCFVKKRAAATVGDNNFAGCRANGRESSGRRGDEDREIRKRCVHKLLAESCLSDGEVAASLGSGTRHDNANVNGRFSKTRNGTFGCTNADDILGQTRISNAAKTLVRSVIKRMQRKERKDLGKPAKERRAVPFFTVITRGKNNCHVLQHAACQQRQKSEAKGKQRDHSLDSQRQVCPYLATRESNWDQKRPKNC